MHVDRFELTAIPRNEITGDPAHRGQEHWFLERVFSDAGRIVRDDITNGTKEHCLQVLWTLRLGQDGPKVEN